MKTPITIDLIRAALQHIAANLSHDDWARLAMAIKSEFPDSTGFDLFDIWSQSSGAQYNAAATRSTWRSVKAAGGVGIGTLLALAKQNGFVMPAPDQAATPPSAEVLAQRERDKAERQRLEQIRIDAAQASAASAALAMWQQASETGHSAYLQRKGIGGHGVRYAADGWLLVSLHDAAGALQNVQRIAPQKLPDGNDKFYGPPGVKGGRKTGLFHLIAADASASTSTAPGVILLAEGYATCASLFEATGYPTAMCCDAGNLVHVAKALRNQYPSTLLALAGDDDAQTFAKTGHNPGREKATAAARAVHGIAVFPEGLPEGGSDFNDLHQHIGGAAGLDAVRTIVQGAIDQHQATQRSAQAAKTAKVGKGSNSASSERTEPQNAGGFDRFFVSDDGDDPGVYYVPRINGEDGKPQRVCGVLRVTAMARNALDNQAALLLEFDTPYRKGRTWLMPLAMLAGDGSAYRSALLTQGFMTPTDAKRRGWMTEYLQSRNPSDLVRHVPRVGWAGRCYVLPGETLGENKDGERVIFHSEAGIEANFAQRGQLDAWKADLSRLCVGNSRLAFAVATAFAGPLLVLAPGTTGGGFHYTGATSIGKTTGFLIAASVWGKGTEKDPDSYLQKWRATGPALEYLGEQHNDCTLILDELGQLDPKEAGFSAYMLADGAGKNRGKAQGGLRAKPSWRLLFLSSGELTLAQHMETIGQKQKGGQEVRLIPIPAEVAPGSALETFHEFTTGHELSGWVQARAARCYGVAGRAWLEYLVAHFDGLTSLLSTRIDDIEAYLMPDGASGQVKRGARRFALVAAAGELATDAGLTGWGDGEATQAAKACFDAWIASRGGAGASEVTSMLKQVRSFFEAHGDARFPYWHRTGDDHQGKTIQRAGLRRVFSADGSEYKPIGVKTHDGQTIDEPLGRVFDEGGTTTYYVLPDVFTQEVCKGLDHKAVSALLVQHGCLQVKEQGRYSVKTKLPGIGTSRAYCITDAVFSIDV